MKTSYERCKWIVAKCIWVCIMYGLLYNDIAGGEIEVACVSVSQSLSDGAASYVRDTCAIGGAGDKADEADEVDAASDMQRHQSQSQTKKRGLYFCYAHNRIDGARGACYTLCKVFR